MILSVTLNPSVDMAYHMESFAVDHIFRCDRVTKTAGGKGLNVARVLRELGGEVMATGFLGGCLGDFIRDRLEGEGVPGDFLYTRAETRNCIAILTGESQTEILERGNEIPEQDRMAFLEKYRGLCKGAGVVSISGSNPPGIDASYTEDLLGIAKDQGAKVVLDVSGDLLRRAVRDFSVKPYAIKPNVEELSQLLGEEILREGFQSGALQEALLQLEIPLVFISCGKDGAYIKWENRLYRAKIPSVRAVNPVGSGDSTVAGLCYGLDRGYSEEETIKTANACGISNCLHQETGHIVRSEVEDLLERVELVRLSSEDGGKDC